MARLIDADALLAKFKEHRDLYAPSWEAFKASSFGVKARVDEIDTCMADVINAPTVDAVEVVHGRWIDLPSIEPGYECSECGRSYAWWKPSEAHCCPNCGARMVLEVDDGNMDTGE